MNARIKKSILLIAIGIIVNIALAAIKMYVGLASNSLCIMLDAMNSFLDTLTCIVTLIVFIVLLAPKSESAPHGYGRGEYLAGFIVAVVSVVMGGFFFIRSINRMAMPEPVYYGLQSMVLISVCLPIKLGMGLMYYFANKKIKSTAIKAIMIDSFLDIGVTATSVVSFAISSNVDYAVDAIFGIVVSVFIVKVSVSLLMSCMGQLTDHSLPAHEEEYIKTVVCNQPGASDPHRLRTRHVGRLHVIDLHFRMDGQTTITEAHHTATAIENKLREHFGHDTIITTHVEPVK